MLKLGLCQPDAEFEWLRESGTKKNQAVLLAIGIQVQGLALTILVENVRKLALIVDLPLLL